MRKLLITLLSLFTVATMANPVEDLVNRIDNGSSSKFLFEIEDPFASEDYFEIDQKGGKVWIKGNNWVSVSCGLNWYLKYHAGVSITWNNPTARLNNLPKVKKPERRSTKELMRYYLNYCTYSYSMWNWDWTRWQQEIDWMALHGVNMPLALVGTANVWKNLLERLEYSKEDIDAFIAGPAHQAWWLMNNMEGWCGPNPQSWYDGQEALQKQIIARYREFGIEPVFAGYCGMVPNNAKEKLGLDVQDPGGWCSYKRPAFLQPTDKRFVEIADAYYEELEKLYGKAKYYSIDPFHEGGSTEGVDLKATGEAIYGAMKRANEGSAWVIQAWQGNPKMEMIDGLPTGDVVVLDLTSEARPQWGDPVSPWYRKDGYGYHDWIYCLLLNYGGVSGMYGNMDRMIDGYYLAKKEHNGRNMRGVGTTMEGIENNPSQYELLYELPWRSEPFTKQEWIKNWAFARYGRILPEVEQAWEIIANTAYNPPFNEERQGVTESVFCARPSLKLDNVSTWGSTKLFYAPDSLERALELMVRVGAKYKGCNNFEYDIVDLARQVQANRGLVLLSELNKNFEDADSVAFKTNSEKFLKMIKSQDALMATQKDFMLGNWIERSMKMGVWEGEKEFYRYNGKVLITTWGGREAANGGGLRDYSHREWNGILSTLYYTRWKMFFDYVNKWKELPLNFDYYDVEDNWTRNTEIYENHPYGDPIAEAAKVLGAK